MKLHELLPSAVTKHRVYFKDPKEVAAWLGFDAEAVRVGGEKYREAAKALKAQVKDATGQWPLHDEHLNRYYLDVGKPWSDRLKELVDTTLTYRHRRDW